MKKNDSRSVKWTYVNYPGRQFKVCTQRKKTMCMLKMNGWPKNNNFHFFSGDILYHLTYSRSNTCFECLYSRKSVFLLSKLHENCVHLLIEPRKSERSCGSHVSTWKENSISKNAIMLFTHSSLGSRILLLRWWIFFLLLQLYHWKSPAVWSWVMF